MSIHIILLTVDPVKVEHPIIHGSFYSPRIANNVDSIGSKNTNLFTTMTIIDCEACSLLA
jgi:hypothetical protein